MFASPRLNPCATQEDAWGHAELLSDASGFEYVDRHGVTRNKKEDMSLVAQILRRYCVSVGLLFQ